MSHCMASVRPIPTACPFTAAMTGLRMANAGGWTGDDVKWRPVGAANVSSRG